MTFIEWLFSSYENPKINGQWGTLHIITLILCAAIIVGLTFLLRKKSDKAKDIAIYVLVGIILFFELSRRCINFARQDSFTFNSILYILLPRPWCAISCWTLIIAVIFRKKFLYNTASISSLLCAIIFFAYPSVGFNNKYILFENLYSIMTHSLLLVVSILFMTLKKTEFKYEGIWKVVVSFAVIFAYAFFEIYVLQIEKDPLYFLPNNDVQEILGLPYPGFLVVYIIFLIVYVNIFYLIDDRQTVKLQFLNIKEKLLSKKNVND